MPSSSLAFKSATWIWLTQGSSIGVSKTAATLSVWAVAVCVVPATAASRAARASDISRVNLIVFEVLVVAES